VAKCSPYIKICIKLKAHSWCNCARGKRLPPQGWHPERDKCCLRLRPRAGNAGAHDNLLPVTPRHEGATQNKWALRFWSSTYKSRGCQEGHQVVATKEDPRAILARGRPHSLTAVPQDQNTLAAGTLSFRNIREARPRGGQYVNRWTAQPTSQAE
jgi:hypothetical protein